MRFSALFLLLLLVFRCLPAAACVAPEAAPDSDVVFLSAYEGGLYSNLSVAGPDEVTTVIRVIVEKAGKNARELHIVAAASTPVIWQVEGDIARISGFVATGPVQRGGREIRAGVAGLPEGKISFAALRDCFAVLSQDAQSTEAAQAAAAAGKMAGRTPLMTALAERAEDFGISAAAATAAHASRVAGVAAFDPKFVVAGAPMKIYKVLPREEGLAQLMDEKKLVKVGEVYKIVGPIQRYPAGLTGRHAVRFILGTGVAPPAGDPGHSCVMLEESERPLNARMANICN